MIKVKLKLYARNYFYDRKYYDIIPYIFPSF